MKLNRRLLRKLINETVAKQIDEAGKWASTPPRRAPRTFDAGPPMPAMPQPGGLEQGVAGMTAESDINKISSTALADALFSGVPNDLYNAISTATGWASKPLAKLGATTPEGMKALALQTFGPDLETARKNFITRVDSLSTALAQSEGFPKTEMPALEGSDLDELQDALTPGGNMQVDASADFKGGEVDFNKWMAMSGITSTAQQTPPAFGQLAQAPAMTPAPNLQKPQPMFERWGRLSGLESLNEISQDPRFPFPGPGTVMPGAPSITPDQDIPEDQIAGQAKAFLTKGLGTKGDTFTITPNQPLKNSSMKPTQTNVKAGKSILFALADIGQDMEGAYATTDGEILDGHHRWSGQYLRTGGNVDMLNVHLIDKAGMSTPEFLTMLTVTGNALGRPTKLKESSLRKIMNQELRKLIHEVTSNDIAPPGWESMSPNSKDFLIGMAYMSDDPAIQYYGLALAMLPDEDEDPSVTNPIQYGKTLEDAKAWALERTVDRPVLTGTLGTTQKQQGGVVHWVKGFPGHNEKIYVVQRDGEGLSGLNNMADIPTGSNASIFYEKTKEEMKAHAERLKAEIVQKQKEAQENQDISDNEAAMEKFKAEYY